MTDLADPHVHLSVKKNYSIKKLQATPARFPGIEKSFGERHCSELPIAITQVI